MLAAVAHHAVSHSFGWHIGHWLGYSFLGYDNESGSAYGNWSGWVGGVGAITLLTGFTIFYWHHTCHQAVDYVWWKPVTWIGSCWHLSHHDITDSTGVTHRVCHKHHPHRPARITAKAIEDAWVHHRAHHQAEAETSA